MKLAGQVEICIYRVRFVKVGANLADVASVRNLELFGPAATRTTTRDSRHFATTNPAIG